jgi:hypothetical protein
MQRKQQFPQPMNNHHQGGYPQQPQQVFYYPPPLHVPQGQPQGQQQPGYENPQAVYRQFPYQSPYPGTIPQQKPQEKKKSRLSAFEWILIIGMGLCLLQGFLGIQPLNFSGNYKSPHRYEGAVNNPQGQAQSNAYRWDGE